MNRKNYIFIAICLLILPVVTSCRNELCYNHFPSLDLGLSWEQEWERDYGMHHPESWDEQYYGIRYQDLRPNLPEWVTMLKYENENAEPNEHFLTVNGGEIILGSKETGSMLFYNGDTEYIVLSDMASLNSARASATTRSRAGLNFLSERHGNVRSTNPPDLLYAAFVEKIPEVEFHSTLNYPVKMQPLVYTYLIRFEFEKNQEYISLARGALGGMAESVYLRSGHTSDESSIILFDCDVETYGCQARVRSFGVPGFPDEYYGRSVDNYTQRPYSLTLEVLLKNGKTKEFDYDITDQILKQPRGGVISISGLRIEDSESKVESGFEAEVTDWGDAIEEDLPIDPY